MHRTEGPRARALKFHSLSDPTRLQIIEILRSGEHCVCELTERLELGQSLLSFHLKTLKEAGLVADRREGRWSFYRLQEDGFRAMAEAVANLAAPPRRPRAGRRCEP